ncbi:hypothetical protein SBOR_4475 [Sclerotinia borealis F-4128]|uniref:Uncharacterized protein n=1 Tax=Sclerotinia borealis (strain F-4128) TaxID=1432307 RepID=W9CGR0_SCLBF|nr:hypothetical protein SBOR_4475 [Sclerotinia borealis F-4128]
MKKAEMASLVFKNELVDMGPLNETEIEEPPKHPDIEKQKFDETLLAKCEDEKEVTDGKDRWNLPSLECRTVMREMASTTMMKTMTLMDMFTSRS